MWKEHYIIWLIVVSDAQTVSSSEQIVGKEESTGMKQVEQGTAAALHMMSKWNSELCQ